MQWVSVLKFGVKEMTSYVLKLLVPHEIYLGLGDTQEWGTQTGEMQVRFHIFLKRKLILFLTIQTG